MGQLVLGFIVVVISIMLISMVMGSGITGALIGCIAGGGMFLILQMLRTGRY